MGIKRAANQLASIHAKRKYNANKLKNKEFKSKNYYKNNNELAWLKNVK